MIKMGSNEYIEPMKLTQKEFDEFYSYAAYQKTKNDKEHKEYRKSIPHVIVELKNGEIQHIYSTPIVHVTVVDWDSMEKGHPCDVFAYGGWNTEGSIEEWERKNKYLVDYYNNRNICRELKLAKSED